MQDEPTEGVNEEIQPQTPEPEPTEPPEEPPAEEPEAEAKGEGETEEPAEGGEPEPEPTQAKEKHRRKGGWERSVERLERVVSEKDQIIQQLSQKLGGPTTPAESKPKDQNAQVQEYVSGLVREQLAAERAQAQQVQQQAEFQRRVAATRAAHPDFEEALQDVAHIPIPAAFHEALLTSEQGSEIMYQLAKNPAELARLSALPPLAAAREIGRLEAKASSTPAPKTSTKSATRPPAPPTTVGGSASSTRSLDDLPLADYKRAYRSGKR